MTEAEYLASRAAPMRVYDFAVAKTPFIKRRLVAAASCRFQPAISVVASAALHLLENYARGHISEGEFVGNPWFCGLVESGSYTTGDNRIHIFTGAAAIQAAYNSDIKNGARRALELIRHGSRDPSDWGSSQVEATTDAAICHLVRDICGNPFRPWRVLPAWMGQGVVQPTGEEVRFTAPVRPLAEVIDRHRHYDRLPVLADALEESGVTDRELLDHCRDGGPHHPGCWAVDLALGRAIRK